MKKTMTQFERDVESANLRAQIMSAREHADRTEGEMKEANLAHMRAAIEALRVLNQWRYLPKEHEH
jgi:hypothetical protein